MKIKIIVESIDRLGKDTLIDGILQTCGYFEVLHFQKPKQLSYYNKSLFEYQRASFENLFQILRSPSKIILNRSWIGEAVYGPIYRQSDAEYVWELEQQYSEIMNDCRLILLTEDFQRSKHFVEDGESFDVTKREQEQKMFLDAFNQSIIKDKRIINVTDQVTGEFRNKKDILEEAING